MQKYFIYMAAHHFPCLSTPYSGPSAFCSPDSLLISKVPPQTHPLSSIISFYLTGIWLSLLQPCQVTACYTCCTINNLSKLPWIRLVASDIQLDFRIIVLTKRCHLLSFHEDFNLQFIVFLFSTIPLIHFVIP